MDVITGIEYDVYDLLIVNKAYTNGKRIGIGIDPDVNNIVMVDMDNSEILDSKKIEYAKELEYLNEMLDKHFGSHSCDENLLIEFLANYAVEEVMV